MDENRLRLVWRILGQLLMMGILLSFSQLALTLVTGFPNSQSAAALAANPGSSSLLLITSGLAVAASVWLGGKLLDKRQFQDFGLHLNRIWWLDLLFGLLLGAGLMAIIFTIEYLLGWIQVLKVLPEPSSADSLWAALAPPLLVFILVGIYEELFNRGYLIKNLSEGFSNTGINSTLSIWAATTLSSLLFGFLHRANPNSSPGSILNISLAGVLLAIGYLYTGHLAIPIGLHITWNTFQGLVFGFPVSGARINDLSIIEIEQMGPDLWTGGNFGPEAGLLGTTAMLLGMGCILAWAYYRSGVLILNTELAEYQPQQTEYTARQQNQGHIVVKYPQYQSRNPSFHLIWDWNGTLLDDFSLCLEIINSMLKERKLPVLSRKRYREIFDFPIRNYYQQLGFQFSIQPFEEVSTEFITIYERRRGECQLMPGAHNTLEQAARIGFTQSIISASKREYLLQAVEEYEIINHFFKIMGLDNHHAAGKEILVKEFIDHNNIPPQQIVMIGDTSHDAEIATAAGIHCILIPHGHHSHRRLEQTGGQLVESLSDIPPILEKFISEA